MDGRNEESAFGIAAKRLYGLVYFIQPVTGGPIKIGMSNSADPSARLSALQTGCPFPLALRHVEYGTEGRPALQRESDYHRRFDTLRLHGEWFRPAPNLAELCNAIPEGQELTPEAADEYRRGVLDGYHHAIERVRSQAVDALNEALSVEIEDASWNALEVTKGGAFGVLGGAGA